MRCAISWTVWLFLGAVMMAVVVCPAWAGEVTGAAGGESPSPPPEMKGLPLLLFEDFEKEPDTILKQWKPTDPKVWTIEKDGGDHAYALKGQSDYSPPVRSPHNISLFNTIEVTDFVLQADMKQTGKEYGHRDMCIFFGYQDPAHFYYVHIATKADAHANSIFIVNDEPRLSIAKERTDGTDWGEDVYNKVRVERDTGSGAIKVFFNDMDKPIMVAEDKTFVHGKVGFGSFDDTGIVDNVTLWGKKKD
jgi:hypothetical protein